MANVFDGHGKIVGAGGGQAGDTVPVDAPGPPSASDLHRYFCEPYCSHCRKWEHACVCNTQVHMQPGLHTRDPRTKVEGLRWAPQASDEGEWIIDGLVKYRTQPKVISPAHAADLLVMGVVKVVWRIEVTNLGSEWMADLVGTETSAIQRVHRPTLPEAVALAYHRMLDAEEQG